MIMEKTEFLKELDQEIKKSKTYLSKKLNSNIFVPDEDDSYLVFWHELSNKTVQNLIPKLYDLVDTSLESVLYETMLTKNQMSLFDLNSLEFKDEGI